MNAILHILKSSGRLDELEGHIRSTALEVIPKIEERISLPHVDVVIEDNPKGAIPETGVGGYAKTAHILVVSIDPKSAYIQNLQDEIKSTLAHELHHCARMNLIGYGETLLEALVSEGLADHFDIEVNGNNPKPWSTALPEDALEKVAEKAKPEFNNSHYNHSAWFFGSQENQIPRWAGYSLGFHLVKNYLTKTGKKASELVGEPASSFN